MADEKQPITFVLLDESILTNGFRVKVGGVDLEQFKRNPVMFYIHEDESLPMGKWVNIRKENNQILADADLDYQDTNEEVQRVIGKIEREFLRMASAHLVDLELSSSPDDMLPGQVLPTILKSRFREASIVPIGGCNNALRLSDSNGDLVDLSDELKLSDFIKPLNIKKNMNVELLKILKLSDTADDSQVAAAVKAVIDENTDLKDAKEKREKADKEAEQAEAKEIIDVALKDGRLNDDEKKTVSTAWLKLFDNDFKTASDMLAGLPKKESISTKLSDKGTGGDAWAERQKEIEEKNKHK
ncbi:hypothetical protein [Dysgonomonas sp. ZJ709]|uniref:hypothetical protein n=1 Tax=Dysgonomonas sp. ZJ709 TaxID=2709797 RepID=UPI0013ECC0A7|nr:hypothetical protein [Dysgonomonas sp. ZJ709]